jgi:hypothetical protein
MSRLRYWSPGRDWVTVSPGVVWYKMDEDQITICALLSGAWGGTSFPEAGAWDWDVDQVWRVQILKTTTRTYEVAEYFDLEPIIYPVWDSAYCELGNKPHRAIGYGMRDGEFISRVPVTDLEGVRRCDDRLVMYETPADRRAVRLWAQAEVRRAEAWRRRWAKTARKER